MTYQELYSPIMTGETEMEIIQCFAIAVDVYMTEFGFTITKAERKVLSDINYYSGYYEKQRRNYILSILHSLRSEYIQDEIVRLSYDVFRDL